jgi:hypothetical protein
MSALKTGLRSDFSGTEADTELLKMVPLLIGGRADDEAPGGEAGRRNVRLVRRHGTGADLGEF